jgi:hypothetical protein
MENNEAKDRLESKILSDFLPSQMKRVQKPFVESLNSFVSHYFQLMVAKYGLKKLEVPKIKTYKGNVLDIGFLGYVKPIRYTTLFGEVKSSGEIMIDEADVYHAQISDQPYSLLERLGGYLGTTIRWSVHSPPKGYVPPFMEEQSTEGRMKRLKSEEDSKKALLSEEFRKVSYFFGWVGRHVLRDVVDSSWKLDHELFGTDVKPFFPKQREEVLQRVGKGAKIIREAEKNTGTSKGDYGKYSEEVKNAVEVMLGEWGHESNQSDNPFDREVYHALCLDYLNIDETLEEVDTFLDVIVKNDWGFESDKTPLQHFTEEHPTIFQDLLEGKVQVTPEVAYERLVRMAKEDINKCLNELETIIKTKTFDYFDLMDSEEYGYDIKIFRAAEDNESFILQNLPTVVRMPDEEVKTKFFPNL